MGVIEDIFCPPPKGEFQALENWPVVEIGNEMAAAKLDLVLHMGDYVYRQWLCPWDKVGGRCEGS